MQQWQQWMRQGRHAWDQGRWQQAQWHYEQAFADVWPIWQQATLLPQTWSNDMDELCLPTHCMVVTIRNLAHTLEQQGQSATARQLIQHTQQWLHCALQQPHLPAVLIAALWQQQTELCQHWHSMLNAEPSAPQQHNMADTSSSNNKTIKSLRHAYFLHDQANQHLCKGSASHNHDKHNITARIFRTIVAA